MAKALSQDERQLIQLISKLPVQDADKTAWTEQIQNGDMNEELAETIRARLNETGEDGSPVAAKRPRHLADLANLVRRWRLSSQSHNFGSGRR